MNKQDILLRIAKDHFDTVVTLDTRHRDSLDFHDVSVGAIRAALSAAYDAGLAAQQPMPQAAPQQPLQASRFVEAANTTVTVEQRADSYIEVKTITAAGTETQGFAKYLAEDVKFLSAAYAHHRVDVFMAVVELLGEVARKM